MKNLALKTLKCSKVWTLCLLISCALLFAFTGDFPVAILSLPVICVISNPSRFGYTTRGRRIR